MFTRWNYVTIGLYYLKILNNSPWLIDVSSKQKSLSSIYKCSLAFKAASQTVLPSLWEGVVLRTWDGSALGGKRRIGPGKLMSFSSTVSTEGDCTQLLLVPHFPLSRLVLFMLSLQVSSSWRCFGQKQWLVLSLQNEGERKRYVQGRRNVP